MAGEVIFNNGVTYATGASTVFNAYITETIKQYRMEESEDLKAKMGFTTTTALNPNQVFSTAYGIQSLDNLGEGETKKEMDREIGPKKGFAIKEFGNKITTTHLFTERSRKAKDLAGAPESIQAECVSISENAKVLMQGAERRVMEEMVKLWTLGFANTASYGPGSLTPKGQFLFDDDHSISMLGTTQSNLLSSGTGALTSARLQAGLDQAKGMLFDNGHRVGQPKGEAYKIFVSTVNAVTARQILNTEGSQAGMFSARADSGTNVQYSGSIVNQYNFKGNLVEVVELDILGTYDNTGTAIGTNDYWFLMNARYIREAKALRYIDLYPIKVNTYFVDDTNNEVADIRMGLAVDHYGAELGLFGSVGSSA